MSQPTPYPDAQKLKNILLPAAALAAVIVLVGLVIGLRNPEADPIGGGSAPDAGGDPNPGSGPLDASSGDMSTALPPLADPAWRDIGGGLKIWDVKEGTGSEVKPGAQVTCHYIGWLTTGKQFDSSVGKGPPASFSLNGVVAGWGQGLPGMKAGGIRRLYIPAALGYGPRGQGSIPPNSDLVFEVKMISAR